MINSITHKKAHELISQVNFPEIIYKKWLKITLRRWCLVKVIGQNRNYLYQQLSHSNQSASVILTLSEHLQTNLFEPYVNLLSEPLSTRSITRREKNLEAQVTALLQQLAEVTKERDIYKTIAMK